jgi:hypothetical protein
MPKNDIYDLPEELLPERNEATGEYSENTFAHFENYRQAIEQLAHLVAFEDWSYHQNQTAGAFQYPILSNYIKYTYKRLAAEKKVAFSRDNKFACFDTGLISRTQLEPVYLLFSENTYAYATSFWKFESSFRRGEAVVRKFDKLPDMAFYWDNPAKLIYDTRKELVANVEHIIQDNKERFPMPYNTWSDFQLRNYLDGCIAASIERVKRNYKTAVPHYFFTGNTIQLLIPLCMSAQNVADLALVVEDYGSMYRASTCLTLDMAMNNARLLARPDRDWLNP